MTYIVFPKNFLMSPKTNQTPGADLPSVVGRIVTWLSKIVSLPKLYSISPVKLSKFFPLDLTHTAYLSLMVTVMCLADATGIGSLAGLITMLQYVVSCGATPSIFLTPTLFTRDINVPSDL